MCLILFAHHVHPDFPLVLASNRDEFFSRPAAAAGYWTDAPDVLGGRDLKKGGAWMGVTRTGRWAAVTNYRDGTQPHAGTRSRGELVASYLTGEASAWSHAETAARSASAYAGFNLLLGDESGLYYVAHGSVQPRRLGPGIYGLSNHLLDSAWPKVERGKRGFEKILGTEPADLEDELLTLLADRQLAEDHLLPQTGIDQEWEKFLSAAFIAAPGYGTRASSVLLIGGDGEIRFRERSFGENGDLREDRAFRFTIDPGH